MSSPIESDRQPGCLSGVHDPAVVSNTLLGGAGVPYEPSAGPKLALLLLRAFRTLVDDARGELALVGHPGVRDGHEFAMRAIEAGAVDAVSLSARLDVSKQAAAKIIAGLETRGYVTRESDPADGRRKPLRLTRHGRDLLEKGQVIFDRLREESRRRVGSDDFDRLEATLYRLVAGPEIRHGARSGAEHSLE